MTDKELWNEASKYSFTVATVFKLLKRIDELEQQNKQLRCCMNCTNRELHNENVPNYGGCERWEMKK